MAMMTRRLQKQGSLIGAVMLPGEEPEDKNESAVIAASSSSSLPLKPADETALL